MLFTKNTSTRTLQKCVLTFVYLFHDLDDI